MLLQPLLIVNARDQMPIKSDFVWLTDKSRVETLLPRNQDSWSSVSERNFKIIAEPPDIFMN